VFEEFVANTSPAESTASPPGFASDPTPLAGNGSVSTEPPAGSSTTVLMVR
jgi:hypothetical protein